MDFLGFTFGLEIDTSEVSKGLEGVGKRVGLLRDSLNGVNSELDRLEGRLRKVGSGLGESVEGIANEMEGLEGRISNSIRAGVKGSEKGVSKELRILRGKMKAEMDKGGVELGKVLGEGIGRGVSLGVKGLSRRLRAALEKEIVGGKIAKGVMEKAGYEAGKSMGDGISGGLSSSVKRGLDKAGGVMRDYVKREVAGMEYMFDNIGSRINDMGKMRVVPVKVSMEAVKPAREVMKIPMERVVEKRVEREKTVDKRVDRRVERKTESRIETRIEKNIEKVVNGTAVLKVEGELEDRISEGIQAVNKELKGLASKAAGMGVTANVPVSVGVEGVVGTSKVEGPQVEVGAPRVMFDVDKAWGEVKAVVEAGLNKISDLVKGINQRTSAGIEIDLAPVVKTGAVEGVSFDFSGIGAGIDEVVKRIQAGAVMVMGVVTGVIKGIRAGWDKFVKWGDAMMGGAEIRVVDSIEGMGEAFTVEFSGMGKEMLRFKELFYRYSRLMKDKFGAYVKWMGKWWEGLWGKRGKAFKTYRRFTRDMLKKARGMYEGMRDSLKGMGGDYSKVFDGIGGKFGKFMKDMMSGMGRFVKRVGKGMGDFFKRLGGWFKGYRKAGADVVKTNMEIGDSIEAMNKDVESGVTWWEKLRTVFEGLQVLQLDSLGSQINEIVNNTGNLVGTLESQYVSMEKSIRGTMASVGLVGKEARKVKGYLKGLSIELNTSVESLTNTYIAFEQGGKAAKDVFKSMGIGIKELAMLEEGIGVKGEDMVRLVSDWRKSWGYATEDAKDMLDYMAKIAKAGQLGSAAFEGMQGMMKTLNAEFAKVGKSLSPKEMNALMKSTLKLAGTMVQGLGIAPSEAMEQAQNMMTQMVQHMTGLQKMFAGMDEEFSGLFQGLSVDLGFKNVNELLQSGDVMKFATFMNKAMTQLSERANKGDERAAAMLTRLSSVTSEMGDSFAWLIKNNKAFEGGLAKLNKRLGETTGGLKKLAKESFTTGRTISDWIDLAEQQFDQTFRNITLKQRDLYGKRLIDTYRTLGKEIQNLASDKNWGPLMKRFSLAYQIGFEGFILPMRKGIEEVARGQKHLSEGAQSYVKDLEAVGERTTWVGKKWEAWKRFGVAGLFMDVSGSIQDMAKSLEGSEKGLYKWVAMFEVAGPLLHKFGQAMMPFLVAWPAIAGILGSVSGAVTGLVKSVGLLGSALGGGVLKAVMGFGQGLLWLVTGPIKAVTFGIGGLISKIPVLGSVVSGVGGMFGGLGRTMGALLGPVGRLGGSFLALGASMGGIVAVVGGVMLAMAALDKGMDKALTGMVDKATGYVKAFTEKITNIDWKQIGRSIIGGLRRVFKWVIGLFVGEAGGMAKGIGGQLSSAMDSIGLQLIGGFKRFGSALWDMGKALAKGMLDLGNELGSGLVTGVRDAFYALLEINWGKVIGGVWDMVKRAYETGVNWIGKALNGLDSIFQRTSAGLGKFFDDMKARLVSIDWGAFTGRLKSAVEGFAEGFSHIGEYVAAGLKNIEMHVRKWIGSIGNVFSKGGGMLKEMGTRMFNALASIDWGKVAGNIMRGIGGVVKAVGVFLIDAIGNITSWLYNAGAAIVRNIGPVLLKGIKALGTLWNKITDQVIAWLWDSGSSAGSSWVDGLWESFKKSMGKIWSGIKNLGSALVDLMGQALSMLWKIDWSAYFSRAWAVWMGVLYALFTKIDWKNIGKLLAKGIKWLGKAIWWSIKALAKGLLGLGAYLFKMIWEGIKFLAKPSTWIRLGKVIWAGIKALGDFIYGFIDELTGGWLTRIVNGIKTWLAELGNSFGNAGAWISEKLSSIGDAIKGAGVWIVGIAGKIGTWIYENLWEPLKDTAVVKWLISVWSKVVDFFGDMWNSIVGMFKSAWNWLKESFIGKGLMWIVGKVQTAIDSMMSSFAKAKAVYEAWTSGHLTAVGFKKADLALPFKQALGYMDMYNDKAKAVAALTSRLMSQFEGLDKDRARVMAKAMVMEADAMRRLAKQGATADELAMAYREAFTNISKTVAEAGKGIYVEGSISERSVRRFKKAVERGSWGLKAASEGGGIGGIKIEVKGADLAKKTVEAVEKERAPVKQVKPAVTASKAMSALGSVKAPQEAQMEAQLAILNKIARYNDKVYKRVVAVLEGKKAIIGADTVKSTVSGIEDVYKKEKAWMSGLIGAVKGGKIYDKNELRAIRSKGRGYARDMFKAFYDAMSGASMKKDALKTARGISKGMSQYAKRLGNAGMVNVGSMVDMGAPAKNMEGVNVGKGIMKVADKAANVAENVVNAGIQGGPMAAVTGLAGQGQVQMGAPIQGQVAQAQAPAGMAPGGVGMTGMTGMPVEVNPVVQPGEIKNNVNVQVDTSELKGEIGKLVGVARGQYDIQKAQLDVLKQIAGRIGGGRSRPSRVKGV